MMEVTLELFSPKTILSQFCLEKEFKKIKKMKNDPSVYYSKYFKNHTLGNMSFIDLLSVFCV